MPVFSLKEKRGWFFIIASCGNGMSWHDHYKLFIIWSVGVHFLAVFFLRFFTENVLQFQLQRSPNDVFVLLLCVSFLQYRERNLVGQFFQCGAAATSFFFPPWWMCSRQKERKRRNSGRKKGQDGQKKDVINDLWMGRKRKTFRKKPAFFLLRAFLWDQTFLFPLSLPPSSSSLFLPLPSGLVQKKGRKRREEEMKNFPLVLLLFLLLFQTDVFPPSSSLFLRSLWKVSKVKRERERGRERGSFFLSSLGKNTHDVLRYWIFCCSALEIGQENFPQQREREREKKKERCEKSKNPRSTLKTLIKRGALFVCVFLSCCWKGKKTNFWH